MNNLRDKKELKSAVSPEKRESEAGEAKKKENGSFDHFFSLVTKVKTESEKVSVKENAPLSHSPQDKTAGSIPKIHGIFTIFKWLTIALEEGHVEPAQPEVGRLVGWPIRKMRLRSFAVDFFIWCQKQSITMNLPTNEELGLVLDQIFHRSGDEYELPPLDICRKRFLNMRQQYERS